MPFLLLATFGIVMVYSSTSYLQYLSTSTVKYDPPSSYALKQGAYLIIALVAISILYRLKTSFLRNKWLVVGIYGIIGALLVFTFFAGKTINGAKGWLSIAGFSLQPAEFLKIIIVWYLAYILSNKQELIAESSWQIIKKVILLPAAGILLVAIQPDIGGAVILVLITFCMIVGSGIHFRWSQLSFIALILGSFAGVQFITLFGDKIPFIKKYIYGRFAVFRNPFTDVLNTGHQLAHSYYAIHNGGWWGLGLGNSIEKKGFLPEAQTDFVFSILIEEMGLVFALGLLAVLFFMIGRMYLLSIRAKDAFNSMILFGIATIFLVQTFVNLGGVLGIIPMTGVTFPFISQGGSSLIMLTLAVGISLNVAAEEKKMAENEQFNHARRITMYHNS